MVSSGVADQHWVCIDCGARQAEQGPCAACKHELTLDSREEKVRDFMADVEGRLTDQRESRARFIGVLAGMTLVFGAWMVPGYWGLRGRLYPGLPFIADQWLFMILIGLGLSKILAKYLGRPRFPYLDEQRRIID